MITVEESLLLPELASITVRSGQGGLSRRIRWTHIMGGNKIGQFLEGGELLLTSGKGWPEDPILEEKLLHSLLNHQISGIIFATGHYLKGCPPAALEFGEFHDIPILEMPFDVPFVKISKAINQLIMNKQFRKNELMNSISPGLTKQLTSFTDFKETCDFIANYLKCPIILTTFDQKILTTAIPVDYQKPFNPSRQVKMMSSQLHNTIFEEKSIKPFPNIVRVSNPEFPNSVVVLLLIGNDIWGILWLLNLGQVKDQSNQQLILEYFSSIFIDIFVQQKQSEAKEKLAQLEMLEFLIEKTEIDLNDADVKLRNLGFYHNKQWVMGIVLPDLNNQSISSKETTQVRDAYKSWLGANEEVSGFCQFYKQQLILLISSDFDNLQLKQYLNELHSYLIDNTQIPNISILFGGIKTEWKSLNQSYDDIKSLLSLVKTICYKEGVYFSDELRREMLLYQGFDRHQAIELRKAILPAEFFTERGEVFYETLKCLALNNFNREKTSEILHIHRNTLRYRIERIEELLQCRLSTSKSQFWVQVALDLETLAT